jgi:hypothetical protein
MSSYVEHIPVSIWEIQLRGRQQSVGTMNGQPVRGRYEHTIKLTVMSTDAERAIELAKLHYEALDYVDIKVRQVTHRGDYKVYVDPRIVAVKVALEQEQNG